MRDDAWSVIKCSGSHFQQSWNGSQELHYKPKPIGSFMFICFLVASKSLTGDYTQILVAQGGNQAFLGVLIAPAALALLEYIWEQCHNDLPCCCSFLQHTVKVERNNLAIQSGIIGHMCCHYLAVTCCLLRSQLYCALILFKEKQTLAIYHVFTVFKQGGGLANVLPSHDSLQGDNVCSSNTCLPPVRQYSVSLSSHFLPGPQTFQWYVWY